MRPIGPESHADRTLRQWFEEQEKRNLDRLEEGAKTITQLVTGLFGLLLAILTLSSQPVYLKQPIAQWLGGLGVLALFIALLTALVALYPRHTAYREDNLSEMKHGYRSIMRRKIWGLRVALWSFVIGTGLLGGMIVSMLWRF